MEFSEILINERRKIGLSQEELGDKVNVARQTISKWENGETVPDAYKLIELSKLFNISIDKLVGNSLFTSDRNNKKRYFEFTSKTKIGKLPLVHINFSYDIFNPRSAKGIFAIGNFSKGVFAFGGIALGLFALGGLSFGLISLGGLALALLLSIGGISIGSIALGGLALGLFALGGLAVGMYSIGGLAVASRIAGGSVVFGHIAIGEEVLYGSYNFLLNDINTANEVRNIILKEFPNTWKIIVEIFANLV